MGSARNIIFITCLLYSICYSQAVVPGKSFFPNNPGTGLRYLAGVPFVSPTTTEFFEKYAEELICGKNNGWAANFINTRAAPLENPCGKGDIGTCKLIDFNTDYECECIPGYKFNVLYDGTKPRTCIKSKSLVTCKPGTRRVAAEKLIVGINTHMDANTVMDYKWVVGTYERVAGEGYPSDIQEKNINQGVPVNTHPAYPSGIPRYPGGTSIQQYRHDVPIKGREYYVQYEREKVPVVPATSPPTFNCIVKVDTARSSANNEDKKIMATLSFNYKKNQWQFTNKDILSATYDANVQVYSREEVKCVEDATEWSYTYKTALTDPLNVGVNFVDDAATTTEFQIRDTESTPLLSGLNAVRDLIKCP